MLLVLLYLPVAVLLQNTGIVRAKVSQWVGQRLGDVIVHDRLQALCKHCAALQALCCATGVPSRTHMQHNSVHLHMCVWWQPFSLLASPLFMSCTDNVVAAAAALLVVLLRFLYWQGQGVAVGRAAARGHQRA
jgi:hypothetical protein